MAARFGVHVGSSSACLAVFKEGRTYVVANDSGDRVTPAMVAFNDSEKIVGTAAYQQLIRSGANVIVRNKQFVGKTSASEDLEELSKGAPCKVIGTNDGVEYEVNFQGKTNRFSSQDICTLIYRNMHDMACSNSHNHSGGTLPAVLTVPLSFSAEQCQLVKRAAESAGFQVLQLMSEPAAAVLAYGLGQDNPEEDSKCVVYRAGGASLEASLVCIRGGMYWVEGNEIESGAGGQLATQALSGYLSGEFYRRTRLRPEEESWRSARRLAAAAEDCKRVLSSLNSSQCLVESLCQGADLACTLSRARFDSLLATLIPRFLAPVHRVLEKAQVSTDQVNKVVLCGGATKMPRLQQALSEMFPTAEILGSIPPDEVITLGAAAQAGLLSEPWDHGEDLQLTAQVHVLPSKLAFKTDENEDLICIIPAKTPIPVKRMHKVPINEMGADVTVHLYECPDGYTGEEKLLADLVMKDLGEKPQLNLSCHVRLDGSLHVALTDQASGRVTSIDIDGEEE